MNTNTKGSHTPLATCDNSRIRNSGASGIKITAAPTTISPYQTACFPQEGQHRYFQVRACSGAGCSDWSVNQVEFVGQAYACFRNGCEEPCWPGGPRRFPQLPPC